MTIGFVLDDTLDSTDGIQQYILALGSWLASQGHMVHYLVGETVRTDIANLHSLSRNVKVRFNGNRMSMPLPAKSSHVKQLFSDSQFDILHVQVPYSPLLAGRIIAAAPATTHIVGTFHIAPDSQVTSLASRALAVWSRPGLRKFEKLWSVSTAAQDFAYRTYRMESDILPNVVDVQRFAAARRQINQVPRIVFLGRLVPRKGCQLLLEAANLLKASQHFKVVIGGKGPLLPDLQKYVAGHGLTDVVDFAGFITEADKADFLAGADIAVFPSSGGESFGIVLLEAMAAGAVVLAADNPGYTSVMGTGNPQLFKVNDARQLAGLLQRYLTDETARQALCQTQTIAVQRYDTAVVGRQLEAAYQMLLAGGSRT